MVQHEIINCGQTRIHTKKVVGRGRKGKRNPRTNPTTEAVAKNNQRYAIKELTAKLNYNFKPKDYHITLTYKGEPPTPEQAQRDRKNFIRNVRNECKRRGIELKDILVTEYENHRIHHHAVTNNIPMDIIEKYWNKGYINFKFLEDSGNYYKLAEYLIKETNKTFKKDGCTFKRRYSASRNIVSPPSEIRTAKASELKEDIPKPTKGYYIDLETIKVYENPFNGARHMQYIEVALTGTNTKHRRRGRKGKIKEVYPYEPPKQLSLIEHHEAEEVEEWEQYLTF